jgi:hypothetical protein
MSIVTSLIAAVPNPAPVQPPGTQAFSTVLTWLAWGVSIACLIGILATAATMAVRFHRGDGGAEHLGRLGFVLVAAVLGTAAGPMINAVMG